MQNAYYADALSYNYVDNDFSKHAEVWGFFLFFFKGAKKLTTS